MKFNLLILFILISYTALSEPLNKNIVAGINIGTMFFPKNEVQESSSSNRETTTRPFSLGAQVIIPVYKDFSSYASIQTARISDGNEHLKVSQRHTLLSAGATYSYLINHKCYLYGALGPLLTIKKLQYELYSNDNWENKIIDTQVTKLYWGINGEIALHYKILKHTFMGFQTRSAYYNKSLFFITNLQLGLLF